MREPARDGVSRDAFDATVPAPRGGFGETAFQDRPCGLEPLAGDFEAEVVEAAERRQVGCSEGSVGHVGVFRMDGVGTSNLGGPRPLSSHRRLGQGYTLNCEEPLNLQQIPGSFGRLRASERLLGATASCPA